MALFARLLLRAAGWRVVGEPPRIPRCVVIFAPHTSNWDFPLLLLLRLGLGRRVSYLAKHTLFRAPFAWFFRASGALPVERGEPHDLVHKLARAFSERPELWLAMSPEGTRARTDHWKSGFYYIALEAQVPVLLAFIDARRRECGLGELIELSGDVERDLGRIAAFYRDKQGIVPERAGEIRFQGADLQE
jgi:1-acyl-sn-glycerol-3-phosphate acyltransferase